MLSLVAANTVAIIIGIVVGLIVLAIIMHFVNRSFRVKYNYNLAVGGFFSLLSIGGIVGGILLRSSGTIAYILIAAGIIILIPLLLVCFKRCGASGGTAAFFLQLLFCVPSIFYLLGLKSKNYTPTTFNSRKEKKIIEQQRAQKGYGNPRGHDNRYDNGYGDYDNRNKRR